MFAVAGKAVVPVQGFELPVHRRSTPAGVGCINHVVVNESCGVQKFDSRGGICDAGVGFGAAAGNLKAPPGGQSADALAGGREVQNRPHQVFSGR